jgi:hypothetical protein
MPDINLLDNNHPKATPEGGAVPSSLNYIGAGILVLAIIFSAGAWYLSAHAESQDASLVDQTQQIKQQVLLLPNYASFINEQNSLQGLSFLVKNHLDWSKPAQEIAGVTLSTVSYTNITINQDGSGTLEGIVPSYAALDEYLQALNNKTISPFIASATLQNVSATTTSGNAPTDASGLTSAPHTLTFTVDVTFTSGIWGAKQY